MEGPAKLRQGGFLTGELRRTDNEGVAGGVRAWGEEGAVATFPQIHCPNSNRTRIMRLENLLFKPTFLLVTEDVS